MQKIISAPKITILCFTYNQKKYIHDALKGFENQTIFDDCEILVHDDCSNDGTLTLIKDFQSKYPDQVKIFTESNNRFSIGDFGFFQEMFIQAKGKYIAVCEGDDYWTNKDKLREQKLFLDKHGDYSMIYHRVKISYEDTDKFDIYPNSKNRGGNVIDLVNNNFIPTASVMYRNLFNYGPMEHNYLPQDWVWHVYHAKHGGIAFDSRIMAVYRRNSNGVWWDTINNQRIFWNQHYKSLIKTHEKFLSMFADDEMASQDIKNNIYKVMLKSFEYIDENGRNKLLEEHGGYIAGLIVYQNIINDEISSTNKKYTDKILQLKKILNINREDIQYLNAEIEALSKENNSLRSSLSWRVTQPMRAISAKLHYNKARGKNIYDK